MKLMNFRFFVQHGRVIYLDQWDAFNALLCKQSILNNGSDALICMWAWPGRCRLIVNVCAGTAILSFSKRSDAFVVAMTVGVSSACNVVHAAGDNNGSIEWEIVVGVSKVLLTLLLISIIIQQQKIIPIIIVILFISPTPFCSFIVNYIF